MNIPSLFALTTGEKTLGATSAQAISAEDTNTDTTNTENSVPSTSDSDTSTSDPRLAGEEFDTFLTLLTAQIQNQDPLAPLDSTQFVEQLATFTSLELQAKGNDTLTAIANMLAAQLQAQGIAVQNAAA